MPWWKRILRSSRYVSLRRWRKKRRCSSHELVSWIHCQLIPSWKSILRSSSYVSWMRCRRNSPYAHELSPLTHWHLSPGAKQS
jgi:hypothetical protein